MSLFDPRGGAVRAGAAPRLRRRLVPALAVAFLAIPGVVASAGSAIAAAPAPVSATNPDLGPNVTIFTPDMSTAAIKAKFDSITAAQFGNEFGPRRDAIYFMPGTYGTPAAPLNVQVGYYTEVAGLGASPTDVVINGTINVYNRCLAGNGTSNCLALTNFWRSMSNLTINVAGGLTNVLGEADPRPSWCTNTEFWAVSQAAPLRRVNINGNTSFMDYCTAGPQYASGGFNADNHFNGAVINGSQQQFFTRNSSIVPKTDGSSNWTNAVWNQVFSGVVGAPAETWAPGANHYTVLDKTPVSREKPYLFVDSTGTWNVQVPDAKFNSSGITWANGLTPGRTIPLSKFFIANPHHSVKVLNKQLSIGKNILLTPGVYSVDQTIAVNNANAVVLGLGYATLTSANGATPLAIGDVPGVVVAGVTVEAGPTMSENLVRVGTKAGHAVAGSATNPTTLSDVFLRVGGAQVGKVNVALEVNSDNTLIDHTWIWRADHGQEGLPKDTVVRYTGDTNGNGSLDDDARWVSVIGNNGLVVNGTNVTATGLFVEHFQKNNVVWNGENGTTIFFQNELPYDPPTQEAWNAGNGGNELGWAAYKVSSSVTTHNLYGAGAYVFNQNNPAIHTTNGFESPSGAKINLYHLLTVNLSAGTIDHVVNGIGGPATTAAIGQPVFVTQFP